MGLFLTIVYLLYMLGTPAAWLPFLAQASALVYLSALACIASLGRLLTGSLFRHTPQVVVFGGFFGLLVCTPLLQRWLGGVFAAFRELIPYLILLFLVRVNCDATARRKIVIFALLLLMTTLALVGAYNYHAYPNDLENKFIWRHGSSEDTKMADQSDIQMEYRLKAQGILDDPNDFAQIMLVTIALSTVFWGQSKLASLFLVLVPGSVLLHGIYLTRSRGALVAIVVTMMVVLRRRLKLWGAALAGMLIAAGLLIMKFAGGRQISVSSGADRLELWSEGLYLFKRSFGLGIGIHNYVDQVGQTAHNSILLVAVESGFIGLTLFLTVFVICFTQLQRIIRPVDGSEPDAVLAHEARSFEAALTAYLATSWFLSRAYNPVPYLLVGLVAALAFQAAERSPGVPLLPRWPIVVRNSLVLGPICLACIYILVRLRAV